MGSVSRRTPEPSWTCNGGHTYLHMNALSDEEAAARRSNRRTIIAIGGVMLLFGGPLLYALARYLISLI